jgi:hypothetical protein
MALWSASGFLVHEALANLGVRLATSATIPLRIDYLPRDSYVVSASSARRNVMLADLEESLSDSVGSLKKWNRGDVRRRYAASRSRSSSPPNFSTSSVSSSPHTRER